MRVAVSGVLVGLSLCGAGRAQLPRLAQPIPMPQDRVADSYAIYSFLLPSDTLEWSQVPRTQWLLEDTTTAEPEGTPCDGNDESNPHQSVKPPEEGRAAFAELLRDFDAHCHDRYQLDGSRIQSRVPVHMMDADAQRRFQAGVAGYLPPPNDMMRAPATPQEFKGAAGLHRFRAVYFNHNHTLAMTEMGMFCGSLCGNWRWVVLERGPGGWRRLHWATAVTFS